MGCRVVRCQSATRVVGIQFCHHSYDYRPNRIPLRPNTIVCGTVKKRRAQLGQARWPQSVHPFAFYVFLVDVSNIFRRSPNRGQPRKSFRSSTRTCDRIPTRYWTGQSSFCWTFPRLAVTKSVCFAWCPKQQSWTHSRRLDSHWPTSA